MPSRKRGEVSSLTPNELAAKFQQEAEHQKPQPLSVVTEPGEPKTETQRAGAQPKNERAKTKRTTTENPAVEFPQRGYVRQVSGKVKRRVTLSLPAELGQLLTEHSEKTERTESSIVAEALRKLLKPSS